MRSLAVVALLLAAVVARAEVVVAEGEQFAPKGGWKVTPQDETFGSHTYGGMWMSQGGCLGAAADDKGSVATQTVTIPAAGKYRVWSKYQAPPYFNYLHEVEVVQNGKSVFKHTYGKMGTPRLWSFSGTSDELWWPWGVDHDAAEAPKELAELAAGPAEIRLVTVANPKPAGDRYVDFVLLTTNAADDYQGFKPYKVGTPFANEALAATKLWMRFKNTSAAAAQLSIARGGHFQPNYGGETKKFPEKNVEAGQWSPWFNVGPFCRLVHDEGLTLTLPGAGEFAVQFARDEAGKNLVGDVTLASGEAVVVPIDITWRTGAKVRTSKSYALELIEASKKWRTANGGKKPQKLAFFGAFNGKEDWVADLKHAVGYNTVLPEKYRPLARDHVAQHHGSVQAIQALSKALKSPERERLRVVSFGDEIGLGEINFNDAALNARFRDWLKARGVTEKELGTPLAEAKLTKTGNAHLVWYSNLFNEEERFGAFREMTELVKKEFGPDVLTGANYSPHHLALYYGPVYQWVDIFKHKGMSMIWAEDYVFSVPEVPQIVSWQFAQMRCGAKYHDTPIHFYVMPHAPGQAPANLRRNMLLSVGYGAKHIDNFWIAPPERFTENYVGWRETDTWKALHEAIFDAAEAEQFAAGGKVRPARVAVVTGKATDFNESRLQVDKAKDVFASRCANAPGKINQTLCRKDQQMLYLALRQYGHAVDVITEDDIVDGAALKNLDVIYFAGEWIDTRAVKKLEEWVTAGGVLYATAGCGHKNQFDEPCPEMLKLLGLKEAKLSKNVAVLRTLLELPQLEPLDTITLESGKLESGKVPAVGMKQVLTPDNAKVLGKWADGSAAVTVREAGKGKVFAVGTLAGNSWMKTGLRVTPFARGGHKYVYNPEGFSQPATALVALGVDAKKPEQAGFCHTPGVEVIVTDHPQGTLVTLVNWTNAPLKGARVSARIPQPPSGARSVALQKKLQVFHATGTATFQLDLDDADFVLLLK